MSSIQDVPKPAYGGQAVRIRPYWSQRIVENAMQYNTTFNQINFAAQTLRKYTLSLNWENTIRVIDFRDSLFVNSSAYLVQLQTIRDQLNHYRLPAGSG